MAFVEASAKTNHNVREAFTRLAQLIITEKLQQQQQSRSSAGGRHGRTSDGLLLPTSSKAEKSNCAC